MTTESRMTTHWKSGLIAVALLTGPLIAAVPAFAAAPASATTAPVFPLDMPTAGATAMAPHAATITVAITNLDPARTPPAKLTFYFVIPGDSRPDGVVAETGTRSADAVYKVPVPSYGHAQTVYIESSYRGAGGGLGVTIDGPLIDMSGAPLAATPLPIMHAGRFHHIELRDRLSQ